MQAIGKPTSSRNGRISTRVSEDLRLGHDHPLFDDIVAVGLKADSESLQIMVGGDLVPGPNRFTELPRDVAWALAERAELMGVLRRAAQFPMVAIPVLTLEIHEHGLRLCWGETRRGRARC